MSVVDGDLQDQLRETAFSVGAGYFGVADLAAATDFVTAQGGEYLAGYPVAVSAGVVLADGVVDELHQHLNSAVARIYRHHIYTVVADRLDRIAGALAFEIEGNGYQAYPVPSTGFADDTGLAGVISHKLAAHLAGLGWIGKNCLLITKEHGPRVRWVTVLTDAPLAATGEPGVEPGRCGSCTLCVDLCPHRAFTGIPFDAAEPVEARFDRQKCRGYLRERGNIVGVDTCGICVHVCPHGWSEKRKKTGRRMTPALLRERLADLVKAIDEVE